MCRKTELLAPAGSFAILRAAINAGADAVYAAGGRFGARAYAENFTEEEMLEAIDYVHLKGKRLYLTVNTLLKEPEIRELYDYLAPLYEAGLDAVIVQDMGVLHFVRKHFPELPIHASTQMTVTGAYGAKLLQKYGCSRIVAARELSLREISNIYKETGAEIECFVHGALCYSYSGQCLLSSMIGGRSGNRGRCAQPCRLPYELLRSPAKEAAKSHKGNYLLSLKDLCAIELIPELAEAGIHSFKIEGRMKQAEYVAGVTAVYRKYLDMYEASPGQPYQVDHRDYRALLDLGSRCGFTDGYYKRQNGGEMVTFRSPSHEKNSDVLPDKVLGIDNKEKINGILRLSINNPASLVLEYRGVQAKVAGGTVQRAEKQPLTEEAVLDKINKTGDTPFQFETLELEIEENSFIPVSSLNRLRRAGIAKLTEHVLGKYRRDLSVSRDTVRYIQGTARPSCSAIYLSALTETAGQFKTVLKQPETERIYLESFALGRELLCQGLKDLVQQAHNKGKSCYLALPYIFRMETSQWYGRNWRQIDEAGADGYLIRNLEELSFLQEMGVPGDKLQGDYQLYAANNESVLGWEMMSLCRYTLPPELNARELESLECGKGELVIYGYQPVMISAQCLHKNVEGCGRTEGISYLRDRYGKLFPVKNHCEDCYNILYNISPLALFHQFQEIQKLHPAGVRLLFTVESPREVEQIFQYYRQAKAGTLDRSNYLQDYTNGHFKRGVK